VTEMACQFGAKFGSDPIRLPGRHLRPNVFVALPRGAWDQQETERLRRTQITNFELATRRDGAERSQASERY
jgi:methylase of polypeptide subunit release factors